MHTHKHIHLTKILIAMSRWLDKNQKECLGMGTAVLKNYHLHGHKLRFMALLMNRHKKKFVTIKLKMNLP